MVEQKDQNGMNVVDLVVPLSGSRLFDMTTYATAINLCARYPGLRYTYEEGKQIHIQGVMDDDTYEEVKVALFFEAGNFLSRPRVMPE